MTRRLDKATTPSPIPGEEGRRGEDSLPSRPIRMR